MRIISGKYRGRRLTPPQKSSDTRPTLERVKENLFNVLQNQIADACVLDLFAGSGALGFEAISRGAKKVVFCDKNRDAIKLLNENLTSLKADPNEWQILSYDYQTALRSLSGQKFDIIFIDPPYGKGIAHEALKKIKQFALLNERGTVVIEEAKKELKNSAKDIIIEEGFSIVKQKDYGSVSLLFLEQI